MPRCAIETSSLYVHCINHLPDPDTHPLDHVMALDPATLEWLALTKQYSHHVLPHPNDDEPPIWTIVGWADPSEEQYMT